MAVLVFGSVNIDRTFSLPHWVALGETILSSSLSVQAGGKGANQAVALSKAGVGVSLAATIGSDGLWIKDLLDNYGVETSSMNVKDGTFTGNATILLDEKGRNSIVLYGGGNRENGKEYIDSVLASFNKGDWLILQNEINNLDYVIEKAVEKGMKICLNPSPFEKELLSLPLGRIDLLVVNEIEMSQLAGKEIKDNIESYRMVLRETGDKYSASSILLTLGEKGSLFLEKGKNEILFSDIVKTDAVDTTAAGDTFLGYFLSSVIEGRTYPEALRRASMASSMAVSRKGAMDSIPLREEVDARG
jgi:ribokinase